MNAPDDPLLLSELVDDGSVAAVVTDGGGRVVRATSAAAALLGFTAAGLAGQRLNTLVADGWQGAVENSLLRVSSGSNEAFEALLVGRSGRRCLVRMVPRRRLRTPDADGYVLFWRRMSFHANPAPRRSEAMTRRFAYGLLRRHDDQRGRIAVELSHEVASLITVAKLTVENAAGQLQRGQVEDASSLLFTTSQHLRDTLANVRRISTELVPSSLNDLGLAATIEWLCRNLREAHPDMRVGRQPDVDDLSIGPALKVDLYRIIEEALNNAARHARASRARVTLTATHSQIQLTIDDDGDGFDVDPFLRGDDDFQGIGLHSIGSRIDATHGSLHVESMPGAGTSIVATWPLEEASAGQ